MRRYAQFFIAIAVSCLGAAPYQAFGEEALRLVEDPVAGVRIGIPSEFPLDGKSSKWGRSWSSHDGTVSVNTLAFAPGRTINDIYERLTAIKGRVLAGSPRLSGSAFALEGRDADGMAFYIAARQDGTVVRGVSIVYSDARKRESAELVRRIAQSFALLSDAGEATVKPGESRISKPSPSPANCAAETSDLERVARGVTVAVSPPDDLSVGGKIAVRWQAASRFPAGLPVYLIFTMPEEVRIETVVVSGLVDEKTGEAQSALKGYIALPPTARAPQEIAFGAGGARLFAPFHQPGSVASGAFNILPYRAGSWPLEYAVVARTSCGERLLTSASKQTFAVNLGAPKVVIQDPFPLHTPDQLILSNSGAYSLQVFKDRYRVFDTVTGALIVERAGSAPNFSPTSRYLTAASGGADARGFKRHDVIDLVTGEVIAQTGGTMIGWSNGDAFLVDADQDWGLASAYQALISDAASTERQPLRIADSPMSCHACVASSEAVLDIDLDNGIIVFFNAQAHDSGGAVLCELSGGKCSAGSSRNQLEEMIRKDYAVVPFNLPELKKSWASLAYSHIDEGRPASGFKVARHKQQSAGRLPLSQPGLGTAKVGDWRSTVRPRSVAPGTVGGKGYFDQLGEFGIAVAGLSELTVQWPTPEWARAEKAGIDRYNEPGRALYAREFTKLKSGLLADLPDMNSLIGPGSDFPYEGKLAAGQKIDLESDLLGAWSLTRDSKPIWLLQINRVEGTVGNGYGALFLLDSRRDKAERLVGAEKGLEGWVPAGEVDQIRFQIRITDGGYLLYSALVNKEIRLYDIEKQTELSRIPVPTDSDLQIDLRVTKDLRHLLQVNSDGQFFLYETATAKRLLSGWFVDDEMLVYTQDGYFRSSYEGASLVHVKFPGMRGLHSFQQFASQLDNPRIIQDLLAGQRAAPAKPVLTPPPRLAIELAEAEGKQPAHLVATASATGEMRWLRLFADGQPLKTIELKGASIKEDIPLSDAAGARLLTMLAVDDRGLVSQPQSVNLAAPGRQNATLFGVFVGVNKYAGPGIPQLAQAVSDATNAEAAFKLAAAKTYAAVKTSLLTDERASPSSLRSAIEAIAAEAHPEDTFVLFFAGHGLQSRDGKFYLTSTGFKLSDPDGTGMSWGDLAKTLSKVKARVVLLIDACHSGSIGAQLATNDGAVADLLQGSGRPILVFAAAKGRQFSYENASIKGGYFTHFLCRILTKDRVRYDLNKNGILEISELYLGLKEEVSRKVWDDERGTQTPWLARRDMIGDFGLF